MRSALRKLQACPRHKVRYNSRNKNLAGLRLSHNTSCRMHRYTADIPAPDFNLSGMQTSAERQADLL